MLNKMGWIVHKHWIEYLQWNRENIIVTFELYVLYLQWTTTGENKFEHSTLKMNSFVFKKLKQRFRTEQHKKLTHWQIDNAVTKQNNKIIFIWQLYAIYDQENERKLRNDLPLFLFAKYCANIHYQIFFIHNI